MEVTLSDGTVVKFKTFVSHKVDKAYFDEVTRGVSIEDTAPPANNVRRAYEVAILLLVESPSISQEWLDNLSRDDYGKLFSAANTLLAQTAAEKAEGKKSGE